MAPHAHAERKTNTGWWLLMCVFAYRTASPTARRSFLGTCGKSDEGAAGRLGGTAAAMGEEGDASVAFCSTRPPSSAAAAAAAIMPGGCCAGRTEGLPPSRPSTDCASSSSPSRNAASRLLVAMVGVQRATTHVCLHKLGLSDTTNAPLVLLGPPGRQGGIGPRSGSGSAC